MKNTHWCNNQHEHVILFSSSEQLYAKDKLNTLAGVASQASKNPQESETVIPNQMKPPGQPGGGLLGESYL